MNIIIKLDQKNNKTKQKKKQASNYTEKSRYRGKQGPNLSFVCR